MSKKDEAWYAKEEAMVDQVARAFWRRIWSYACDHAKELPEKLPIEFAAHMGTALINVFEELHEAHLKVKALEAENDNLKLEFAAIEDSNTCNFSLVTELEAENKRLSEAQSEALDMLRSGGPYSNESVIGCTAIEACAILSRPAITGT